MIILGTNGGISLPFENEHIFGTGESHDASAALFIDGELVAAIEEERLNRIKHTNKFPVHAIKAVLEGQGLTLEEVDYFATYASEEYISAIIKKLYWEDITISELKSPRAFISSLFEKAFGYKVPDEKICFVDHHMAHASSAFYMSGFEESLILTMDGVGENISGRILYGKGRDMECIDVIPEKYSLGHYYTGVIKFIGYHIYDEYKVMGLAPYGNPATYRDIFSLFYQLLPEGKFRINNDVIRLLLNEIGTPRRKGQPFNQMYQDVAAALQESLEILIRHMASYYAEKSGYRNLCLAGGVAHNCSSNGKLFYSGMFDQIFVQPAAHDAGNSIGAAAYTYMQKAGDKKVKRLEHMFLGTPVKKDQALVQELKQWKSFVEFQKVENIEQKTAELIHEGKIIGWVQGRSEFGPRALGNRSILADPRPEKNKDIVNRMVKKREAYRPFAPSVLEEKAHEYFDLTVDGTRFDYMTFVVKVRESYRSVLGAITHEDGTARVQTVKKEYNPRYWNLIKEFGKLSGVSMVLNTSFNNNVEPIVNSVEDAVTCFLTTGLDCLVIDDYLITKKTVSPVEILGELVPQLRHHTILNAQNSYDSFEANSFKYEIGFNYSAKYNRQISKEVFDMVSQFDGKKSLNELLVGRLNGNGTSMTKILNEINDLWNLRFIGLSPCYQLQEALV